MTDDHGLTVDADSIAGPVRTRGVGAVRTLVLILAWLTFVGAGWVLVPGTALAQETGSLDEVESLMAEGRIIQAREVLEAWLESRLPSASREDRQRGIWLRGKLTVDPSMAEVDFRRLVLEYPGGPYSADALFRLGLYAELRGDRPEARSLLERLIRDYPASPLVQEAESWLTTLAGEAPPRPPPAAPPGTEMPPEARPERVIPAPIDPVEASWSFAVQVGAFSNLDHARRLADRLTHAGYEPRVVGVPGDELARVRVGRFPLREEAEALVRALEARGFEARVVPDAWSEVPVGTEGGGLTRSIRGLPGPAPAGSEPPPPDEPRLPVR